MITRKIGALLLIGVVLSWLPKLQAQEWADFYHNGDSIYEAEAYGRIVEDGYLNAFPYPHKSQYETQYFHPDPNVMRHTYSRVRYNASPEEMERYGRLYEEYQQLVTKDNSTNKRVIYVRTEDAGGGTLIFRSFEGNLELKQCKEPYRNDEEVVGDYRFFRRHTEQKVTSAPSWLDPHLADIQEGQLILDASISLGAQMGADLSAELAMAGIPWRVAGQGLWKLVKKPIGNVARRWGPAFGAGPLGAAKAALFRAASYTELRTNEPLILYRVYGGDALQLGKWWTRTPPAGSLQSVMDSAILPEWGNDATKIVTIQIPSGTTIFQGFAAPQSNELMSLIGGGSQVYIENVNPNWILP